MSFSLSVTALMQNVIARHRPWPESSIRRLPRPISWRSGTTSLRSDGIRSPQTRLVTESPKPLRMPFEATPRIPALPWLASPAWMGARLTDHCSQPHAARQNDLHPAHRRAEPSIPSTALSSRATSWKAWSPCPGKGLKEMDGRPIAKPGAAIRSGKQTPSQKHLPLTNLTHASNQLH